MATNFGLSQFWKTTPLVISQIKRGLNMFCSGVIVFLPSLATMLHTTVQTLSMVMGLGMLAFNSIGSMFGVVNGSNPPNNATP